MIQIEELPQWIIVLGFMWGEGACFLSRWFIKDTVLELGFSGLSKKKLNKLMVKHSILDEVFMLGLRRDARSARNEITYWCVINALCVFLIFIILGATIAAFSFPEDTWLFHLIYTIPTVFTGFVVFTVPISSKNVRKNTSERSLVIQGIAVFVAFVFAIIKVVFN